MELIICLRQSARYRESTKGKDTRKDTGFLDTPTTSRRNLRDSSNDTVDRLVPVVFNRSLDCA